MTYALLIDDDLALVDSLRRTAAIAELELLTATSWDEGLALFQVYSPVLVIADYNLEGSRHGLQLLAEMRELSPSVRLVLLSAYIDDDDAAEIEILGLVDRALAKNSPESIDGVLSEIEIARDGAAAPTKWDEYAAAYRRAQTVSREAFDELDVKLQQRRGLS